MVQHSDMMATVPASLMRSRGQGLSIFPPPVALPGFSMSMLWHERTHAHMAHQWARDQLLNVCIR